MSLRRAIDAKCKECCYDPHCGGGTWREQVAQCGAATCPLWPYRPAPGSGPFADPPRRPEDVSAEWLKAGIGEANSAHPQTDRTEGGSGPGVPA